MAFESLTEKLQKVFRDLRGKGKLSEADVKDPGARGRRGGSGIPDPGTAGREDRQRRADPADGFRDHGHHPGPGERRHGHHDGRSSGRRKDDHRGEACRQVPAERKPAAAGSLRRIPPGCSGAAEGKRREGRRPRLFHGNVPESGEHRESRPGIREGKQE